MDKLYSPADRDKLLALLRQVRTEAGLSQQQLADRLRRPQSFVSKFESGERRLDILELRQVCRALDLPLGAFLSRLEQQLDSSAA
jgi:transcriptional regulator with XRE-family HTH domain